MEDNNKKKKAKIAIVAIVSLLVLVLGSAYAYFQVSTVNNFGTKNIYADTGDYGSVVIEGVEAQLLLNLTANELSGDRAGTSFFATNTVTPVTYNHEEVLGTIRVNPSTDTNRYHCTYTVDITHSGTNDMYTKFTNNYANKSAEQIKLILNGKRYDWNSGMPSYIEEEFYINGGETKNITGGLQFINSRTVNQAEITGTDIVIDLEIRPNSLKCTVVEELPMLMLGTDLNIKMKQLAEPSNASNITAVSYVNTNVTAMQRYTSGTPNSNYLTSDYEVQDANSNGKIYMWYDNGAIYFWSESEKIYLNTIATSSFRNFSNLTDISGLAYVDTSKTTTMQTLFSNNFNLSNYSPISNWDTSKVTSFYGTFSLNSSMTDLNALKNWNTSSATTMNYMLGGGTSSDSVMHYMSYTNVEALSDWDISNVENLSSMFQNNTALTSLAGLENWNTSHVRYMEYLFTYDALLADLSGLKNWNTGRVETLNSAFGSCSSITDISALSNWNVGNVESLRMTFAGSGGSTVVIMHITSLEPLRNWNVGNVTNMNNTFQNQRSITNLDALEDWNVANVETMNRMFHSCTNLTDVSGINDWDVRTVTDFEYMFGNVPNGLHPNFSLVNGTWSSGTFTKTSNN